MPTKHKLKPAPEWQPSSPEEEASALDALATLEADAADRANFLRELEAQTSEATKPASRKPSSRTTKKP